MCRRHTVFVIAFGDDFSLNSLREFNDHLGFAQMVICALGIGVTMTLRGCQLRSDLIPHTL